MAHHHVTLQLQATGPVTAVDAKRLGLQRTPEPRPLFEAVKSCDYRVPLHPVEQPGCGCRALCTLQRGSKAPMGDFGVTEVECVQCLATWPSRSGSVQ